MESHYIGSKRDDKGRKSARHSRRNNVWTLQICPTTGGVMQIVVPSDETVEGLKRAVSKMLRIPRERLTILYKESVLKEGSSLLECGITDGSKLTLLPNVETGLVSQKPDSSVMHALENLSDNQVNDFLSGRCPLTLAMRLGDHMMFVQLQLSTTSSDHPGGGGATGGPHGSNRSSHCGSSSSSSSSRLHPYSSLSLTCTPPVIPPMPPTAAASRHHHQRHHAHPPHTRGTHFHPHPSHHPASLHMAHHHQQRSASSSSSSTSAAARQQQHLSASQAAGPYRELPTPPPPPPSTFPATSLNAERNINKTTPVPSSQSPSSSVKHDPQSTWESSKQINRSVGRKQSKQSHTHHSSGLFPSSLLTPPPLATGMQTQGNNGNEPLPLQTRTAIKSRTKENKQYDNMPAISSSQVPSSTSSSAVSSAEKSNSTTTSTKRKMHTRSSSFNGGGPYLPPAKARKLQGRDYPSRNSSRNTLIPSLHDSSSPVQSTSSASVESSSSSGAIIDSMQHLGQGVYSGTFSGTISPSVQESSGKRSLTTIVHILNDLLGAAHPATNRLLSCSRLPRTAPMRQPSSVKTSSKGERPNNADKKAENRALKGKVAKLQALMEAKRAHRREKRHARVHQQLKQERGWKNTKATMATTSAVTRNKHMAAALGHTTTSATSPGDGEIPLTRTTSVSSCDENMSAAAMEEDTDDLTTEEEVAGSFSPELAAENEGDLAAVVA